MMRRFENTIALTVLLILTLAVTAGCTTAKQPSKIELSADEFDFGTIPNTGPVSQAIQVHNAGGSKLEVTGISTSCGCTTAEIDKRSISPGERADLNVTYDPLAHDGATGEFVRLVYVRSNDPDTPEASLTIRVTVVGP